MIKRYTNETDLIETRNNLIESSCSKDSIIIDANAGNQLIGKLLLKLISAHFQQNPETWFLVSNTISKEDDSGPLVPVISSIPEN